jgi:SAM-dependent methyltransferase
MYRTTWGARKRRQRALRAIERQLEHQAKKARAVEGSEKDVIAFMMQASRKVRADIESVRPINPDARVLEVGSGAHGHIFFFDTSHAVGVDPLAWYYTKLFPAWQGRVKVIAAVGEALPFADESFDIVLSDNVIDHAERPAAILTEMVRVLVPSGFLYFTVNIHHPIYAFAALLHSSWNGLGIRYEIGPFADHTTHFTLSRARDLFRDLPLRIIYETQNISETKASARRLPPRHPGDRLKRLFFKNARFKVLAIRKP